MSKATFALIITVVACCSSMVTLSILTYWCANSMITQIKQQVKKLQHPAVSTKQQSKSKTTIKVFFINFVCVTTFTIVSIIIAIHSVIILYHTLQPNAYAYDTYTGQFIKDFEADQMQTQLVISILLYLFAKYLMYFILYLRLFYLLVGSMFAYSDKLYLLIKSSIILNIIFPLMALMFSTNKDEISKILTNIFRALYLLLDIGIPIWLNILFIKKLYEIGSFFMQPIGDIAIAGKSATATNSNTMNYNININTNTNTNTNTSTANTPPPASDDLDFDLNTNKDDNVNTRQLETRTGQAEADSVVIDKRYHKLLTHMARLSVLSAIIATSSLIFFGVVGVYVAIKLKTQTPTVMNVLLWIVMSFDSSINVFCLILYFDFAISLYNRICGACCATKCVANVMPMCLCCCK